MVRFLATALLTAAIGLFAATAQADMLVGYWSFDDETATDLSGQGNHGTVSGSVFSTEVAATLGSGKAIAFDGDDYVQIAHSASLAFNDVMTISMWIYGDSDTINYGRPLAKNTGDNGGGFEIQRNDAGPTAALRIDTSSANNQIVSTGAIFDETWHHLALVVDRGTVTVYRDGIKSTGTYNHGTGFADSAPLYFGRNHANSRRFTGMLDDVAIWDVALPEDSILTLADGTETPLTAEIPEPSTAFLAILGLLALTGYGWRCRRS